MQSKNQISDILGIRNRDIFINDIHWKAEESNSDSLLFYKIGSGPEDEKKFKERIDSASFAFLVVNRSVPNLPKNAQVFHVGEWPQLQKKILDLLYPLPEIKYIGITGTNGKTTTTDLVLQLGHQLGLKGMSLGTLGVRVPGKTLDDFGLTSPSFIDLRKYLHRYGIDKDFCVMEVSSHALDQKRLYGLKFDAAGWLSFSQDHLDYHKTIEEYFKSKCLIFSYLKPGASLFVPQEQIELKNKLNKFPQTKNAEVINFELPLFFKAQFNRNNLEVAKALIQEVFKKEAKIDFETLVAPDGRFFIKKYQENYIVVDFAHTPDALDNICKGLKTAFPHHSLKVLFGCGGDRDRSKRPLMGEVVDQWADEIYVTSDNPRSEDPDQIIHDIMKGIKKHKAQLITERPEAVQKAFSELKEREILLLAGKGHENYILKKGVKHPYSDIEQVENFIAGKNI